MHPTAGGRRRRRGQHSTQGKPAEGGGSPAGLSTEPREQNCKGQGAGLSSFLPLFVRVNTSFQSRALNNRDSDDEGEHYEEQGIPSRKNPAGCMHALSHSSTIHQFQLHLHTYLYLPEHRATPKCYHLILTALTSIKENLMTRSEIHIFRLTKITHLKKTTHKILRENLLSVPTFKAHQLYTRAVSLLI